MKLYVNKNCYFLIPTKKNPTPDDALTPTIITYHDICTELPNAYLSPIIQLEIVKNIFIDLIKNQRPLHPSIAPYQFGYQWNIQKYDYCNDEKSIDQKLFYEAFYDTNLWLFSNNTLQTWVYNVDEKIIMEIAPSYPWTNVEPEPGEVVYSFETFMQNYKPIAIHEISKETAQKWIKQADDYINIVEAQFPEWCEKNKDSLYTLKHDA